MPARLALLLCLASLGTPAWAADPSTPIKQAADTPTWAGKTYTAAFRSEGLTSGAVELRVAADGATVTGVVRVTPTGAKASTEVAVSGTIKGSEFALSSAAGAANTFTGSGSLQIWDGQDIIRITGGQGELAIWDGQDIIRYKVEADLHFAGDDAPRAAPSAEGGETRQK